MSERIKAGIKGATLDVIPSAGHLANLDNPKAFNAMIARFLDAQPR
jgi:pimeloyl-ACP methyl ester carboxylesterase